MPFSSFGLHENLLKALKKLEFTMPTPIQRMAIPPIMEGRDVAGAAATGSGKTAAFLLPILHRLMDKPRGKTRVLVLAPTRELAAQITDHLRELAPFTHLKGAAVYGGVGMEPQVKAFKNGVDVIVATPGRLLDHFQYPYAKLNDLEVLVLDEADRMLDMGFLPDIRRVMEHIPKQRQTLLFSATMPEPIVELSRELLKDPVPLNLDRKSTPAAGISHAVYPVPHELKSNLMLEVLKRAESESVLAFTRTKHRANRLADFLQKRGVSCARIHGDRSQAQRTEALEGFKKGKYRVLVATDIAARGIDVEALGLVVNFDVPNVPEDYIHRVGRTARADMTGDAYTFVSPAEEVDLRGIERHMGQKLPRQKVEGFDYEHKPQERFEVPLADRIAAIKARRAEERARAKAKLERKGQQAPGPDRKDRPSGPAAHRGQGQAGQAFEGRPGDGKTRRRRKNRNRPAAAGQGQQNQVPAQAQQGAEAPARHHAQGQGQRRDQGQRPRGDRPLSGNRPPGDRRPHQPGRDQHGQRGQRGQHGHASQPKSPFKESFTFIRSTLIPDGRAGSLAPDTSGVREDVHRTHRDDQPGRSNWVKSMKRSQGKGGGQPEGQAEGDS